MKRIAAILLTVIAFIAGPARAEVEISFDFFYDSLAPYGEWCEVDGYGHVWHPSGVDDDWSPYSDGYWTYTDAGWTWVSYEDFGGITYHYGRWTNVNSYGWCWVPDYEWGPAWVSWRRSNDHIGWAPLPPEARWERRSGFGAYVDVDFDIGPAHFRFCRWRDFGAPVIRNVCEPRSRNVYFIQQTINITNISYRDDYGCVYNGGFDYDYVRPLVARPVPALKLVRNTTNNIFINGNKGNVFINSPQGNALVVAAPAVAKTNYNVLTKKLDVQRKFGKQQVNRGWAGLDKEADRERILVKMRDEPEVKEAKAKPARAPKPEALAVLPKKVDLDAKSPALLVKPRNRPGSGKGNDAPEQGLPGEPKPPVTTPDNGNPIPPQPAVAGGKDKSGHPKDKPTLKPEPNGKAKPDAAVMSREPGGIRNPGKIKGKDSAPDNEGPAVNTPPQSDREVTRANDKKNKEENSAAREAAREQAREQAAQKDRDAAAMRQAEAARKEGEKQQRAAEMAEKERKQALDREAARNEKAQREANARSRAMAEQARERELNQRQKGAAEAAARERAAESQRAQADEMNRRRQMEAAQQRAAEQSRERAMENQRKQAADFNARQRAAQSEAIQRRPDAKQQNPSFNRQPMPQAPQSGDNRGKNKGKGKDKDE